MSCIIWKPPASCDIPGVHVHDQAIGCSLAQRYVYIYLVRTSRGADSLDPTVIAVATICNFSGRHEVDSQYMCYTKADGNREEKESSTAGNFKRVDG